MDTFSYTVYSNFLKQTLGLLQQFFVKYNAWKASGLHFTILIQTNSEDKKISFKNLSTTDVQEYCI